MPNIPGATTINSEAIEAARTRLERALLDATPHTFEANTPREEFDLYDEPTHNEVVVHLSISAAHDLAAILEDHEP